MQAVGGKRFSEWFSEWDATEQDHFLETVKAIARKAIARHHLRSHDADDLAQDLMVALWTSSSSYPYISPGLADAKARELAWAYLRPLQVELDDALPDRGGDQFEAMLKREADDEAKQVYKSWLRQIYAVVTPAHRDFLTSLIEMSSDPNIGLFRRDNGVYSGEVRTLTGSLSVRIAPTDIRGIEYIATVAGTETEVGVASNRMGEKTGIRYVWLELHCQILPSPAYCSLRERPDGSYNLVWHRPDAHGPYREGKKRPQFDNKNISKHRNTSVEEVRDVIEAIRKRIRRRSGITDPIKKRTVNPLIPLEA